MYFVVVWLLTLVLPIISIVAERLVSPGATDLVWLIGKWFTFWGIGIRLLVAGISQVVRPEVTSKSILGLTSSEANIIVQELGFANLSMGAIGMVSLLLPAWLPAAALAGGLFLGLAGVRHMMKAERNSRENTALVTDLIVFAAAATFLVLHGFGFKL